MAKIKNPLQFSQYYGISQDQLNRFGVLDPTLNVDAKLFIDPLLLSVSSHKEMQNAETTYKTFFKEIIKLLDASRKENDIAWRTAYKKLLFREIKGTCLGYGAASIRGSGFGPILARQVTATAKEIVDLGVKDPDLFIVLPLLEEDVGPDLISDMTTNIILPDLMRFNQRVLSKISIPTEKFVLNGLTVHLPKNPLEPRPTPVILVPTDILRDLPVANDWQEVCDVASKNAMLRDKVNRLIGEIWKAKTRKDKKAIRARALASKEAFSTLLETIHGITPNSYDLNADPKGIFVWRKIRSIVADRYPLKLKSPKTLNLGDAFDIVMKIVEQFKHLIENRGLCRELWHGGKRREEKSVQRIFFAVADSYCQANNLDISPEVDTGTGEIDFKFSHGYESRILIEAKLSDNTKLVPGYQKQLEAYKIAEKTMRAIYVVIDVGKLGKKYERIIKLKNKQIQGGLQASEVVYIDGSIQPSASKL